MFAANCPILVMVVIVCTVTDALKKVFIFLFLCVE